MGYSYWLVLGIISSLRICMHMDWGLDQGRVRHTFCFSLSLLCDSRALNFLLWRQKQRIPHALLEGDVVYCNLGWWKNQIPTMRLLKFLFSKFGSCNSVSRISGSFFLLNLWVSTFLSPLLTMDCCLLLDWVPETLSSRMLPDLWILQPISQTPQTMAWNETVSWILSNPPSRWSQKI